MKSGLGNGPRRAARQLPDNVGGIRTGVDHLVEHGHRRIGFVGTRTQPDLAERHEAYREGLLSRREFIRRVAYITGSMAAAASSVSCSVR